MKIIISLFVKRFSDFSYIFSLPPMGCVLFRDKNKMNYTFFEFSTSCFPLSHSSFLSLSLSLSYLCCPSNISPEAMEAPLRIAWEAKPRIKAINFYKNYSVLIDIFRGWRSCQPFFFICFFFCHQERRNQNLYRKQTSTVKMGKEEGGGM